MLSLNVRKVERNVLFKLEAQLNVIFGANLGIVKSLTCF